MWQVTVVIYFYAAYPFLIYCFCLFIVNNLPVSFLPSEPVHLFLLQWNGFHWIRIGHLQITVVWLFVEQFFGESSYEELPF